MNYRCFAHLVLYHDSVCHIVIYSGFCDLSIVSICFTFIATLPTILPIFSFHVLSRSGFLLCLLHACTLLNVSAHEMLCFSDFCCFPVYSFANSLQLNVYFRTCYPIWLIDWQVDWLICLLTGITWQYQHISVACYKPNALFLFTHASPLWNHFFIFDLFHLGP